MSAKILRSKMNNGWMVRAGRGGHLFQQFMEESFVAIGWNLLAPLDQYQDKKAIKNAYIENYGNDKPSKTGNSVAMIDKFLSIQTGDCIVTYEPRMRRYLVGKDLGQYQHLVNCSDSYQNIRRVEWLGRVNRDYLSEHSQRSLTSVLTLFKLREEIVNEFVSSLEVNVLS